MKRVVFGVVLMLAVLGGMAATRVSRAGNPVSGTITYDVRGRAVQIVDSTGRQVSLRYCADTDRDACEVRWSQ